MTCIWNKNIKNFQKRFSALYDLYKNEILKFEKSFSYDVNTIPFWKVFPAKNGELTASENNLTLHSSYNPSREAAGINANISEVKNIIFLGFGLGYHVVSAAKEIIRQNKNQKLILIESDINHLLASFCILDWEEVFSIENLIIAVGCPVNQIIPLIENKNQISTADSGCSNAFIFMQQSFIMHDQNYFSAVKNLLERNKTKNKINSATFKKFAKLWQRNSIFNLEQIKKNQTVNNFCSNIKPFYVNNISQKKGFIVIAAGPSLQHILPHLKELKKTNVLISVETALPALLKYDVEPDFILLTDPQYWAYRHIASSKSKESILIAPISVHPAVFRFDCKKILLCSDMIPVGTYFEKQTEPFGDLGAGGSVASCAWNLAKNLGATDIYFAGLDLSFPTKETHIKGSSAEQTIHTVSSRINTAEKLSTNTIYSANAVYAKTYEDKNVLTDSRMKMFAWWFESSIAASTQIKNYSLCKESMKIPGVEFMDVQSLLSQKDTGFRKDFDTALLKNNFISKIDDNLFEQLQKDFINCKRNLNQLVNKAVELSIINQDDLDKKLKNIIAELEQNPLYDLFRLGFSNELTAAQNFLEIQKLLF